MLDIRKPRKATSSCEKPPRKSNRVHLGKDNCGINTSSKNSSPRGLAVRYSYNKQGIIFIALWSLRRSVRLFSCAPDSGITGRTDRRTKGGTLPSPERIGMGSEQNMEEWGTASDQTDRSGGQQLHLWQDHWDHSHLKVWEVPVFKPVEGFANHRLKSEDEVNNYLHRTAVA